MPEISKKPSANAETIRKLNGTFIPPSFPASRLETAEHTWRDAGFSVSHFVIATPTNSQTTCRGLKPAPHVLVPQLMRASPVREEDQTHQQQEQEEIVLSDHDVLLLLLSLLPNTASH